MLSRKIVLAVAATFAAMTAMAQCGKITGKIIDNSTREAVMHATVQLLGGDSAFVAGTVTDVNGEFAIEAGGNGKFIVKVSSIGYSVITKTVSVTGGMDVALGTLTMRPDAVMLEGVTATGQAKKVVLKEDTFVYNANAFRTPEGSVVEELVKRLPGAEISDDGKITINGKEVKKIKVDGKEFMTGDTETALKNLPTSIINNIKSYDEKSDMAKMTGIDDGNEETVLDFGIKPGMNKGTMANTDLAVGNHSRYAERLMGGFFNDKVRTMVFGNFNNTNDRGFPGGGGGWRPGNARNGLNTKKMVGVNFNYEEKDRLEIDGHARWNHTNNDTRAEQSAEYFNGGRSSFANSLNQSYSRRDRWVLRMRMEWTPDSMTTLLFRPELSTTTIDKRATGLSANYNSDPFLLYQSPLDPHAIEQMAEEGSIVSTSASNTISYDNQKYAGATLLASRKLNGEGRNITIEAEASYNKGANEGMSLADTHLYGIINTEGNDSTYQTNRYSTTPTKSYRYSVQATYSEPVFRKTYLQVGYKFAYGHDKSDRSTFDFSKTGGDTFSGLAPAYRGWGQYLARLGNPIGSYLDNDLSRSSDYRSYIHEMQMTFRMVRGKYQMSAGVMLQPQRTRYRQVFKGISVDTVRTVTNFSPTFDLRYNFSKVSRLRISYRGTAAQPAMADLLDITDDSDPMNIRRGNPGLKPAFTHSMRLLYNNYIPRHQRAVMTFAHYSNTRNAVAQTVAYDEKSGARTSRPENVNGNWNANAGVMFNTAIDSTGYFNVNTFTMLGHNNHVGYVAKGRDAASVKNTTRTTNVTERLGLSFRNSWIEVELDGSLNYTHARNLLQEQNNLDTWQFGYGASTTVHMPWGMSVSTDLHEQSRRGYNDRAMNTNELIWNAQISQGFLKNKALTVMLQFHDILHRQSSFTRTLNSMMRSDTRYNSINSYAMLHVTYRLNAFGGGGGRGQFHGNGGRGGHGFGRPGGFGGRRRF